jgi:predicted nucleic acid-binding protein
MAEQIVYLDSGALVKRYIKEDGTDIVDNIFRDAESNNAIIYSSLWNIGEVTGVFDRYDRKNIVKLGDVLDKFLNEIERLGSKGSFEIVNINYALIKEATNYVIKHHIYIADALQIASCKSVGCNDFFTSDKNLNEAATKEKINSVLL